MRRGTRWALSAMLLLGSLAAAQQKPPILVGLHADEEIQAPTGVAHAYDAVWLLARAIQKAGTADRPRVRDALEQLEPHQGLLRTYRPAFTATDHEALEPSGYKLATFSSEGVLIPVKP